jgi:hypothetical protein
VPITRQTWRYALSTKDQETIDKIARVTGEENYPKSEQSQWILAPYHDCYLSMESAQALYDAGLKDVDVRAANP